LVVMRTHRALCHTDADYRVRILAGRTASHTTLGTVLCEIASRTLCYTATSGRVGEGSPACARGAVIDTIASGIIRVVVRAAGADSHTEIGGVVCVVVERTRTGAHPCVFVSKRKIPRTVQYAEPVSVTGCKVAGRTVVNTVE
jgi:hypothetical protein